MANIIRKSVPAVAKRSQSESDSYKTSSATDDRHVRQNSLITHPCAASPSLKRVITRNVVQMRRQEFEKIGQDATSSNASSGRQVKSDGYFRSASIACATTSDREKPLCSTPEIADLKLSSKPDVARTRLVISPEFQTDVRNVAKESSLQLREKPPLQPKPSQIQKQNSNTEVSSLCVSNNVRLNADAQNSSNLETCTGKDGNNNCKSPEQKEPRSAAVVPEKHASSPPAPPPKPPRSLSELGHVFDGKLNYEFEDSDGRYAFLAHTTSVVLPTTLLSGIASPGQRHETEELSSTYATIDEIFPVAQDAEVKTTQRSVKEKKSDVKSFRPPFPGKRKKGRRGKTIQVDNPHYMHGYGSDTDDVIPCRPLVKQLSENDLDRRRSLKQELIYDEPYGCVNVGRTGSKNVESIPVALDGQGYAIPDLENNSSHIKAQSRVKSKVRNAYAVLRLPQETGESTQVEDVADEELHDQEQRLIYVKHVHQKTSAAIAKYEKVKLKSSARLFQYGMIIGLEGNDADGLRPKPLYCIPNEIPESDSFVGNFCFPEVDLWTRQHFLDESLHFSEGELFSFVLTSETGDRRYGWCKRYLLPDSPLPEALCIVSSVGECGMYEQLLRALQEFRGRSMGCATDLMATAYARPMPAPTKEVYIRTELPNLGRQTIILKRALNSTLSMVPYSRLLDRLHIPVLLQVFGALLLERKIIFCASELNVLSSCIGAIVALLYPFEWQHTYVTALTVSLIDIVEAPTPYIVGILTSMKSFLEDHDLSEVLLVDLDNGSILEGIGDEGRIIPKKIQRALKTALIDDSDAQNTLSPGTSSKNRVISDETIRETFLRLFIETCAHYKDFILEEEGEETTFQREQFVKAVHSRSIRLFLDWFTQTQMFEVFMSAKLSQNAVSSCNFDDRILDYQDEMESASKSTLSRSKRKKSLGKRISEFFRESGDKIKQKFEKVYV